MEKTGLDKFFDDISEQTTQIELGRKNLHLEDQERAGRILFADGISRVSETFKAVLDTNDPHIIISVEKAFLQQDILFCDPRTIYRNTKSRSGLACKRQSKKQRQRKIIFFINSSKIRLTT